MLWVRPAAVPGRDAKVLGQAESDWTDRELSPQSASFYPQGVVRR